MKELGELSAFGPSLEQLFLGRGLLMEYSTVTFPRLLGLGRINNLHLGY